MITFPNAKINIGLNVTTKRADGFHTIQSIFVPVALCDALEIIVDSDPKTLPKANIQFSSSGISIPGGNSDNLCCKAYELIANDYELPNIQTHLHKIIPIGAGLGGGSADAGFFIRLLNDNFKLGLSVIDMKNYAKQLGSDCPFFIENKAVYVQGTGSEFSPIELDLNGYYIALVNPNIHVSTTKAYASITPMEPKISLFDQISQLDICNWKNEIKNDFEEIVFAQHPVVGAIKERLYSQGAVYASMSGSGSTVYGLFKSRTNLEESFKDYLVWEGEL